MRTIQYLHRCLIQKTFVLRTIQYLHRCLKTKDPLCREQYNIYTDAWKQKTFVLRTIQYLHRCLKTKDPLCHLMNEWRHTFHTFHREPKLSLYSQSYTTYLPNDLCLFVAKYKTRWLVKQSSNILLIFSSEIQFLSSVW